MMNIYTYRLLNEALGSYNLGITHPQNLGIQSNLPGLGEAGAPFGGAAAGGGSPFSGDEEPEVPDEGDEEGEDGEATPPEPEDGDMPFGGEGDEGGDVHSKLAELEAQIAALKAQIMGDEDGGMGGEMGDDMTDLDHDDDLGGDDDKEEEEEDDEKKDGESPFGGAFMSKEGKGENPFAKHKKEKGDHKHKFKIHEKGKEKGKNGDKPAFLMKKKCAADMDKETGKPLQFGCKGCAKGSKKCKNCTAKMRKEGNEYGRPQGYDPSESAWWKSISSQLATANVNQKFDDGLRNLKSEDILFPEPGQRLEAAPAANQEPGPGEPGYSPSTRLGSDNWITAEGVQDILARLKRLERQDR